jgi:hypothetical protein
MRLDAAFGLRDFWHLKEKQKMFINKLIMIFILVIEIVCSIVTAAAITLLYRQAIKTVVIKGLILHYSSKYSSWESIVSLVEIEIPLSGHCTVTRIELSFR